MFLKWALAVGVSRGLLGHHHNGRKPTTGRAEVGGLELTHFRGRVLV